MLRNLLNGSPVARAAEWQSCGPSSRPASPSPSIEGAARDPAGPGAAPRSRGRPPRLRTPIGPHSAPAPRASARQATPLGEAATAGDAAIDLGGRITDG